MQIIPIYVEKEIDAHDDLADLIAGSCDIRDADILVVAQKIISKQEGRTVDLRTVRPSDLAAGIASQYGKDPRIVELILRESRRIVRMRDAIIIVETNHGFVCANAGIDESNVRPGHATLLPLDPDRSARMLRLSILEKTKKTVPVIISDTFGRPFRTGQANCAIGASGLQVMLDYANTQDTFGRTLRVTAIAVADELASSAELVMKKAARCPAAIVRGYEFVAEEHPALELLRSKPDDLFR